jgi:hypothetical protein
MNAQFKINGLTFYIQGDGFRNHEGDFNQIVVNTILALEDYSEGNLKDLHAGSIWISSDDFDGYADESAADALNRIASKAAAPVLDGWRNTDNIIIFLNGSKA